MSDIRVKGGSPVESVWKIDEKGRGRILAVTHDALLQHSLDETTFSIHKGITLPDSNLTELLYWRNDDTGNMLVVVNCVISSSANVEVQVFCDEAYTSGGVDITPLNLNRGSSKDATSLAKENSSDDIVLSGGQQCNGLFIGANRPVIVPIGMILTAGKAVTVKAKGALNDVVCAELVAFFGSPADA